MVLDTQKDNQRESKRVLDNQKEKYSARSKAKVEEHCRRALHNPIFSFKNSLETVYK